MKNSRGFEEVCDDCMVGHNVFYPISKTMMSAGYDFFAPQPFKLDKGEKKTIWTNIKAYMMPDEVLMVFVRSSLAINKGIVLANGTGIIDADYYGNEKNDGNIGICLKNIGDDPVEFNQGDAIAQGIFVNYLKSDFGNSDDKRVGGIGSTGN